MTGDDEELRREGDRIAALLEDLHPLASGPVWQRIEEVVQRLVHLYGCGLERLLSLIDIDDGLRTRLDADPLVASLLLLHGLHPLPATVRARRAADEVCARLAVPTGAVALTLGPDGVATVRLGGGTSALGPALERAILEAAPELTAVKLEGAQPPTGLVQIDLRRHTVGEGAA
jgi:hypothetical protein